MPLPNISDDKRANLFNRANHFRRLNDFDKAISSYELILNEDDSDAEAHWGVLLSRYGIEYVEDPKTHLRVPTLHRMQSESIAKDADYLLAVEHAPDGHTRYLYEQEAKQISEIQKRILSISTQTEPYDVFICYKESSEAGTRTKDSALAQDIYYQLTNSGIKTFYSRITLEDKLGQEYEPYIFAALNSAKVMVVVTTNPANINAVWVKNEWSRFLALMKKDSGRLLIPCYQDMDAYDLPEELSLLQSQDMSKIGFIADLIRGIKKVLDVGHTGTADGNAHATAPVAGTTAAPTAGAESLIKRGNLFLEDKDFKSANEYFDRALDIDPENATAYIGKLSAELNLTCEADLANEQTRFNNNSNYTKAIRFATPEQKARYTGYDKSVADRLEEERLAAEQAVAEKAEQERIAAAEKAEQERIAAAEKAEQERVVAEKARIEAENARRETYDKAFQLGQSAKSATKLHQTVELFKQLGDYQDAPMQVERFTPLAKKARNRLIAIRSIAITATIAVILIVTLVIIPTTDYDKAVMLMESGQYDEAITVFEALGDYKDSKDKAVQSAKEFLKIAVVGDIVTFGECKWRVLDKTDSKLLIITSRILEKRAYNDGSGDNTWERCTLRSYLNNTFYNRFNDKEKALIADTKVFNEEYGTIGVNNTQDKIFLLSINEVQSYFKNDKTRVAYFDSKADWWWLRSAYNDSSDGVTNGGMCVFPNGSIHAFVDDAAYRERGGVRPALWLNL
jgi:tetratricopeptide (TPR) repeat protein